MDLNLNSLFEAAVSFVKEEGEYNHEELIGVTDGKAVGTYVEHLFKQYLGEVFNTVEIGNSAKGIDLPDERIECDIKVTSVRQPQSSCPYKDTRQKIYGLGYNLLLFVYEKKDTSDTCYLDFRHVALIEKERTADYTLTRMINEMLDADANKEDIIGLFLDKSLPGDDITIASLADEVFNNRPVQGYLTISNALQWRLQYSRVVSLGNRIEGVLNYDR